MLRPLKGAPPPSRQTSGAQGSSSNEALVTRAQMRNCATVCKFRLGPVTWLLKPLYMWHRYWTAARCTLRRRGALRAAVVAMWVAPSKIQLS